MLKKIKNAGLKEKTLRINISPEVEIFSKIITSGSKEGKTGLYIHGGAFTGNHTMIERPAKWLVAKGLFNKMILIDRRGDGFSSRLNREFTIFRESEDLKILLDKLNIDEKIIVIGNSYGGPIALLLSKIDERVEKVILSVSSPTLMHSFFPLQILFKLRILKSLIKFFAFIFTGLKKSQFTDLDFMYDLKYSIQYHKVFTSTLAHSPRKELKNIFLKIDSIFSNYNLGLPKDIIFEVPVLQVIGSKDEFWGREFPEDYRNNFPKLKRISLEGKKHKDAFVNAELFHKSMIDFIENG